MSGPYHTNKYPLKRHEGADLARRESARTDALVKALEAVAVAKGFPTGGIRERATRITASFATRKYPMKRWMVVTRVTQSRTYFVDAPDEKAAEAATMDATADLEEDENEETMTISEVPTSDDAESPQDTTHD